MKEAGRTDSWTHEDASIMMFHSILEKSSELRQIISEEDEHLINNLIKDKRDSKSQEWIYEIVSNSRNGIDVDKFDYLTRDTSKTGMNMNSFNHEKVMKGARVIDDKICYPEKDITELKKLFDSRYNLYKDCYHHRVTQAYEILLLDVLRAAASKFDFLSMITDPEQYLTLDDTILHEIRISDEPQLQKARDLLARFDNRKHYSFAAEKVLPQKTTVTE